MTRPLFSTAGTLPTAGGAVKRNSAGTGAREEPDRLVPWPWLSKHRIWDGEVIQGRFLRPLAGLVSGLTPGGVWRRSEAGGDGGQA
jgi:hypothetical protein